MAGYKPAFHSLPDSIQNLLKVVIQRTVPAEVFLFGSRARGDNRPNSDFDIAIRGSSADATTWADLSVALDEAPLTLFQVDLVQFEKMNDAYQHNILNEGRLLYG